MTLKDKYKSWRKKSERERKITKKVNKHIKKRMRPWYWARMFGNAMFGITFLALIFLFFVFALWEIGVRGPLSITPMIIMDVAALWVIFAVFSIAIDSYSEWYVRTQILKIPIRGRE